MFKGCSKLNHIVCNAIDIAATDCTTDWVNGVASAGLFERNEKDEFLKDYLDEKIELKKEKKEGYGPALRC